MFVSDADGDQLHLDYITNIQHGTVVVENGFFTFIPEAGFSGTASFDYQGECQAMYYNMVNHSCAYVNSTSGMVNSC